LARSAVVAACGAVLDVGVGGQVVQAVAVDAERAISCSAVTMPCPLHLGAVMICTGSAPSSLDALDAGAGDLDTLLGGLGLDSGRRQAEQGDGRGQGGCGQLRCRLHARFSWWVGRAAQGGKRPDACDIV
jgi:hypothetical protein